MYKEEERKVVMTLYYGISIVLVCDSNSTISYSMFLKAILKF